MKTLKTHELVELINYTVNRAIPKEFQEFRELEKAVITARLNVITATNKKNPTKEQVLEIVYKELGVQNIWKTLNIIQFTI